MIFIGFMLASMLSGAGGDVTTGMFGDIWKPVGPGEWGILETVREMRRREGEVGYCTNGYTVLEWALAQDREFDSIVMFTDCQLWQSGSFFHDRMLPELWHRYKAAHPGAKLYVCDLAGYGKGLFSPLEKDVYSVSGWSEKIFDAISACSCGESALDRVRAVEL